MRVKIVALLLFSMLLCSCQSSRGLSQRAIVKAIFADEENGQSVVSILAFESEPETDISSAQGKPRIYTGRGDSLDSAFKNAEKSQNKTLFYAHNRLLLLGETASGDIAPYIEYFGAGSSLPRDMALFGARLDADAFQKWEENADVLIRECEQLADNGSSALFEVKAADNMSGFIPILYADAKTQSVSSDSLALLYDAKPFVICKEDAAQLVLLLCGKSNTLTLTAENYSAKTQSVSIARSANKKSLDVRLNAKLLYVTENGEVLKGERLEAALTALNSHTNELLAQLNSLTFESERDIFGFSWWYSMRQTAGEKPESVSLSCELQADE